MWGVDPDQIDLFVGDIRRWGNGIDDAVAAIHAAETLAQIRTSTVPQLNDAVDHLEHLRSEVVRAEAILRQPVLADAIVLPRLAAVGGAVRRSAIGPDSYHDLDRVVAEMVSGVAPADSAMPYSWFPAAYHRWHSAHEDAGALGPNVGSPARSALREILPAATQHGRLPEADAIALAAAHVGLPATVWHAKRLAQMSLGDIVDVAQLESMLIDPDAVVAFFNELGALGLVELAIDLDRAQQDEASGAVARALAVASHDPRLEFDGTALVVADMTRRERKLFEGGVIQRLLAAPGYEPAFLIEAVLATVDRYPADSGAVRTALAAAVRENESAAVVRSLNERGRLDVLLPAHETDPRNGQVLRELLSTAAAVGLTTALLQDLRRRGIEDLSSEVSAALEEFLAAELVALAPLSDGDTSRRPFMAAVELSTRMTGGLGLLAASDEALRAAVAERAAAAQGLRDIDLADVGRLIGEVQGTVRQTILDDAAARDRARARVRSMLSIGTGVVGLTSGAGFLSASIGNTATAVGLAASFDPEIEREIAELNAALHALLDGHDSVNLAVLLGLLDTPLVVFDGRTLVPDLGDHRLRVFAAGPPTNDPAPLLDIDIATVRSDMLDGLAVDFADGRESLRAVLEALNEVRQDVDDGYAAVRLR